MHCSVYLSDRFWLTVSKVYARLTTIQDLIKSFSVDYLRQTNLLLGEGTNLDNVPDPSVFDNALGGLLPQPFPVAPPVEEKKERKKRTHDPNAPKRPLTPYFLYMQTARPIIASDLGAEAPKGAVQEEGQRRWAVMDAAEKQGWNQAYQYNLRLYNARVAAYKGGNVAAKDMSDTEALKYAEQFNIGIPTHAGGDEAAGNEQDAIAQQLQQSAAADGGADDKAAEAKTPRKPTAGRKRKTATPAAAGDADTSKAAVATPSGTDKKRKRTSKAAAELVEEPKKSGRKKTKSN